MGKDAAARGSPTVLLNRVSGLPFSLSPRCADPKRDIGRLIRLYRRSRAVIIVTVCMLFVLISVVAITSHHLILSPFSRRSAFFPSRKAVPVAEECIELVLALLRVHPVRKKVKRSA